MFPRVRVVVSAAMILLAGCTGAKTSSPPPATPAATTQTPLRGAQALANGSWLDLSTVPAKVLASGDKWAGGFRTDDLAAPLRTQAGLVAGTPEDEGFNALWLLTTSGQEVQLGGPFAGVAVAADRQRVAWSHVVGVTGTSGSYSVLTEVRLPDTKPIHTMRINGFARVTAYAGDAVLLDTGDGGGAQPAVWPAGRGAAVPAPDYEHVGAGDPHSPAAVLDPISGNSGQVVSIAPDGRVSAVGTAGGILQRRAFAPDGASLAELDYQARIPTASVTLTVYSVHDGKTAMQTQINGLAVQTVWTDPGTVLVLTQGVPDGGNVYKTIPGSHFAVQRCVLARHSCSLAWTFDPQVPGVRLVQ